MKLNSTLLALLLSWAGSSALSAADSTRNQLLVQTNQSAAGLKKHLLVVYNLNFAESEKLARYYAKVRGIPSERVLGLSTSKREEIDRETFEKTIWNPINAYLEKKGWIERKVSVDTVNGRRIPVQQATRNEVWAMVLMHGIPLKVKNNPARNDTFSNVKAANNNGASVDSELATLPTLGLPISGLVPNPYFYSGYPRPFDAVDARKVILVTRLDGPNPQVVRRMIDDSLYAEQNRLVGRAVFDMRGLKENDNYRRGDDWIQGAYTLFRRAGWDILLNKNKHLIPRTVPITEVGFYAGWYKDRAEAPFFVNPRRFTRGAIAYHLHSFSAASLRHKGHGRIWTGPLLKAGAAASMGTVYEPFLDFTPHIDVFVDRLLQHFTFAESAYMAQRGLSWMTVMVGDPLYRPFALPLPEAYIKAKADGSAVAVWLQTQLIRQRLRDPRETITAADLKRLLVTDQSPSSLLWESYANMLMEEDFKKHQGVIARAYDQAISMAGDPVNSIRLYLEKSKLYSRLKKQGQVAGIRIQLRKKFPDLAQTYGFAPRKKKDPATKSNAPKKKNSPPPRAIPVSQP